MMGAGGERVVQQILGLGMAMVNGKSFATGTGDKRWIFLIEASTGVWWRYIGGLALAARI